MFNGRRVLLVGLTLIVLACSVSWAEAGGVKIGIGIGVPLYGPPHHYYHPYYYPYPYPVYVAPRPVYVRAGPRVRGSGPRLRATCSCLYPAGPRGPALSDVSGPVAAEPDTARDIRPLGAATRFARPAIRHRSSVPRRVVGAAEVNRAVRRSSAHPGCRLDWPIRRDETRYPADLRILGASSLVRGLAAFADDGDQPGPVSDPFTVFDGDLGGAAAEEFRQIRSIRVGWSSRWKNPAPINRTLRECRIRVRSSFCR